MFKKQKNSKEKLDLATDTKQCQVTREIEISASAAHSVVSFAAVFWDVTQRSWGGALRDIPKNGCEGDYPFRRTVGVPRSVK